MRRFRRPALSVIPLAHDDLPVEPQPIETRRSCDALQAREDVHR